MKKKATISIDGEVMKKTRRYLKERGFNFSSWIEQCCRGFNKKIEINNNEKEGKSSGII